VGFSLGGLIIFKAKIHQLYRRYAIPLVLPYNPRIEQHLRAPGKIWNS
jgi:hypothetical protein